MVKPLEKEDKLKRENRKFREKYNKFISALELRDIYLKKGLFELNEEIPRVKECVVSVDEDSAFEKIEPNCYKVTQKYKLVVKLKNSKKFAVKLICEFALVYDCKEEMTKEIFEVFRERNLPVNTWPYFREFVQNMFSRMGLPPLTLPVFKVQ